MKFWRAKQLTSRKFKRLQNSGVKFGVLLKVIADKGYQGITKIHQLSETPIKKLKGKKLTTDQKNIIESSID